MDLSPSVLLDENDVAALWSVANKLRGRMGQGGRTPRDPVEIANRLLKVRRDRAALFGPAIAPLLGEPAYDMLLDLYVASVAGQKISISSACIASGVPLTTALRIVERLVAAGAIIRYPDEEDRRRSLLVISPDIARAIERHLRAL